MLARQRGKSSGGPLFIEFCEAKMLRSLRCVLLLLMCLALAACQSRKSEPQKYSVSGTVTLDGKPLAEDGLIYFKTIATGAIDGLDIKSGRFSGSTEPGDRRVEIVVYRLKMVDINGMKGETRESLIPNRYNLESTLTAKVTPEGPNQFAFELSSK
jgi:hypothetical protein